MIRASRLSLYLVTLYLLVSISLLIPSAYGLPQSFQDPTGDGTVAWTRVSCTGSGHFECVDEGIRDPSTPDTSDLLQTSVNNVNEFLTTTAPTDVKTDETNIWVEIHIYAATGSKKTIEYRVCDAETGGLLDCSATNTIGVSQGPAWFSSANMTIPCSFDEVASDCQTTADDLRIHLKQIQTSGGAGGTADVFAVYYILSYVSFSGTFFTRTITGTVSITDSIQSIFTSTKVLTETITITDTITAIFGAVRTIPETVSITDSIQSILTSTRVLTEAVSITDSIQSIFTSTKVLTETITITDTITAIFGAVRTIPETVSITDSIGTILTLSLTEAVSITDSIQSVLTSTKVLTETITITDTLTARFGALIANPLQAISFKSTRTITETIFITDTSERVLSATRRLLESISVSDVISKGLKELTISVSEVISKGSEELTRRLTASISVSDVISKGSGMLTFLPSELVSILESASTTSSEVFTTLVEEVSQPKKMAFLFVLVLASAVALVIWRLRRHRQA